VNVIRSSNSGIDHIALADGWKGEWFPLFPFLPFERLARPRWPGSTGPPCHLVWVAGAAPLAFGLVGSTRRSGSRQDPPDGVEDEVEPKLELVGVVEAGREQLTADTREVRVRIRRYLGDHR
jgi:hypothetical protein